MVAPLYNLSTRFYKHSREILTWLVPNERTNALQAIQLLVAARMTVARQTSVEKLFHVFNPQ